MTTFPAIEPASRQISFGDCPQTEHQNASGVNVQFLHNTDRVSQTLELGWSNLTESEMYQILNHYVGQNGTMLPFDLPSAIWAGFTAPPIGTEYQWRYANPVGIEQPAPLSYNVAVQLISVLAVP
jgi:hypothetical protein